MSADDFRDRNRLALDPLALDPMALDFKGIDTPPVFARREFLKVLGGGIVIFMFLRDALFAQEGGRRRGGRGQAPPSDFNAFLKIGEDGRVTGFTGKIEMGQGIRTSLVQMLAEELDAPVDHVDIVMGDTDVCPWDMGTFGSMSTRIFGPLMQKAAAEARAVLVLLAADELKVPKEQLATENGEVFVSADPKRRVAYAALAKGKRIERVVEGTVALKPVAERRVVGKPRTRTDGLAKVTGKAEFAGDVRIPGTLHAHILRPPAHGAKLKNADTTAAEKLDGVRVIRDGDLVAVLHATPDGAAKALATVIAEWDVPEAKFDDESVYDHLVAVAPEGENVGSDGDVDKAAAGATGIIEATYRGAYVAHAPIEPHTALAHLDGDKLTVWASTQTPFRARDAVAEAVKMPPEKVRIVTQYLGGGFGGKGANPQVVEAARLAKLAGVPVMVAWTRAEEFFFDTFRPASVIKVRSALDKNGKIAFWDFGIYFAGSRGAELFYDVPDHRTLAYGSGFSAPEGAHPFGTGAWRAPAASNNTFAREIHIDRLAAAAGKDPVQFRLDHLKDDRVRRVLEAAAEKFGWKPGTAPSGRGLGVACGADAGSVVAHIGEIEVDKATGQIRVKRVVCAQEMGQIINPEGARMQIEGCITMGLGYALTEEIKFKGGAIATQNFDTYELPRFSWVPKIETVLVEAPDRPPQGCGEPAIVCMGAIIANGVHDATGKWLDRLPMTPERVSKALGGA